MTNSYNWWAGSNSHWSHTKFDPKIRCPFLSLYLLPKGNSCQRYLWKLKWKCCMCLAKTKHSIWGSFLSSLVSFNIPLYYFKTRNQGKVTRQGIIFFLSLSWIFSDVSTADVLYRLPYTVYLTHWFWRFQKSLADEYPFILIKLLSKQDSGSSC